MSEWVIRSPKKAVLEQLKIWVSKRKYTLNYHFAEHKLKILKRLQKISPVVKLTLWVGVDQPTLWCWDGTCTQLARLKIWYLSPTFFVVEKFKFWQHTKLNTFVDIRIEFPINVSNSRFEICHQFFSLQNLQNQFDHTLLQINSENKKK